MSWPKRFRKTNSGYKPILGREATCCGTHAKFQVSILMFL